MCKRVVADGVTAAADVDGDTAVKVWVGSVMRTREMQLAMSLAELLSEMVKSNLDFHSIVFRK